MENLKELMSCKRHLIGEEEDQIAWLYKDLQWLIAFLQDLPFKFKDHKGAKNLEVRITDVVYEAETAVDLFIVNTVLEEEEEDEDEDEDEENMRKKMEEEKDKDEENMRKKMEEDEDEDGDEENMRKKMKLMKKIEEEEEEQEEENMRKKMKLMQMIEEEEDKDEEEAEEEDEDEENMRKKMKLMKKIEEEEENMRKKMKLMKMIEEEEEEAEEEENMRKKMKLMKKIEEEEENRIKKIMKKTGHGRSLNLGHVKKEIEAIKTEVKEMDDKRTCGVHTLRYLDLGWVVSQSLPASISNLWNLETLIVSPFGDSGFHLPHSIRKMVKLRHVSVTDGEVPTIDIGSPDNLVDYPLFMDNLQTLSWVNPWSCTDVLARSPNLRKLGLLVSKCGYADGRLLSLLPNLDFLNHVQELKVSSTMFVREASGVFPKLKSLKFQSHFIQRWVASGDDFPSLERLVFEQCPNLKKIPSEIGDILTLNTIELHRCKPSLAASAREIKEDQESQGNNGLFIKMTLLYLA
ncbi:hypothetical protein RHMOL_Rhmol09G0128800 [Rhododendron molle]|uniref:Uncharacterized protein n=1 Tax=Rhododendron molle TaxID=49168 RepID=A0ACC0MDZ5_RHOML|nr:hypothetical protein RHMOL_Rhmol09G0128800 [Rhododendron molle]